MCSSDQYFTVHKPFTMLFILLRGYDIQYQLLQRKLFIITLIMVVSKGRWTWDIATENGLEGYELENIFTFNCRVSRFLRFQCLYVSFAWHTQSLFSKLISLVRSTKGLCFHLRVASATKNIVFLGGVKVGTALHNISTRRSPLLGDYIPYCRLYLPYNIHLLPQ